MIINGQSLLAQEPIKDMVGSKIVDPVTGISFGLSELGYDIRIKQEVRFIPTKNNSVIVMVNDPDTGQKGTQGRFVLTSAIEEFQMPHTLSGSVQDKSYWARKGLHVFNTSIKPGWEGFLTLEMVYYGETELVIPAGSGIAEVVFHQVSDAVQYQGRYMGQANQPVSADG